MFPDKINGKGTRLAGSTSWIKWLCQSRKAGDLVLTEELFGAADPWSMAWAWAYPELDGFPLLAALRLSGQDSRMTAELFSGLQNGETNPEASPKPIWDRVAGKDVIVRPGYGQVKTTYFYPVEDAVFMITANDPDQAATIVSSLP